MLFQYSHRHIFMPVYQPSWIYSLLECYKCYIVCGCLQWMVGGHCLSWIWIDIGRFDMKFYLRISFFLSKWWWSCIVDFSDLFILIFYKQGMRKFSIYIDIWKRYWIACTTSICLLMYRNIKNIIQNKFYTFYVFTTKSSKNVKSIKLVLILINCPLVTAETVKDLKNIIVYIYTLQYFVDS